MQFLDWLQQLGRDANPAKAGFQPQGMYLLVSVLLPVGVGLLVGYGMRFIERVLGVELGKGAH